MPQDDSESSPLNDREVALCLLQKTFPGQGVANLGFNFRLPSHVETPVLQRAVRWLLCRHVPLRSTVQMHGQRLVRVLRDPAEITAHIEILRSTPAQMEADIRNVAGRPFELERDELIRFTVLELPDDSRELLVVAHHLVLDALSVASFVSDLAAAYDSFATTGTPPADHAVSHIVPEVPQPTADSIDYWKGQVAGLHSDTMMLDAGDYANPKVSFVGARHARQMSRSAAQALRKLRRDTRATESVVLLTAYLLLLRRHGAGDDLVVGVPVDLRPAGHENMIGHHFSILPLRVRLMPGDSFSSFTRRVFGVFLQALEHRGVSYETMAHQFHQEHYDWEAPFFRHLFNFWPKPSVIPASPGWGGSAQQVDTGYSRLDLEMVISVSGDNYDIQIAYRSDVHDENFVRRFYDRYEALLLSAAADPQRNVGTLQIETHHDAVIKQVNSTVVRWPAPHNVAAMIAEQARSHPHNIAIDTRTGSVSYQELSRMAALAKARIAAAGATAGGVVAVTTGRSTATAAAVLATWSLGAAYLPLDPGHPVERHKFELTDSAATVLVGSAATASQLGFPGARVVEPGEILDEALETAKGAGAPGAGILDWDIGPDARAYIIYTSGSTGRPKGVQITHANLANVIRHFTRILDFGPSKSMTWLTTFAFDISALELLMPLSSGGRVVIADDDTQLNAGRLGDLIRGFGVDVLQATPTLWRLISDLGDVDLTGRWLLSGGEPLTAALARRLLATGACVLNVYGPTETTIWSTAEIVTEQSVGMRPTVGMPIANTTIRLIDESGDDCPVDVVGEVLISGVGVGAGYLGNVNVNASGFVSSGSTGRAYRTGDLGLWRPDGRLELLGRKDRQIKIRGQRLELGEVEAVLEEHPAVTSAAVVIDTARSERLLTAFISSRPSVVTAEELWNFAALRLPGYALPSSIQFLDALPVNSSGKVDHRRLSELAATARVYPAPPACLPQSEDQAVSWLTEVWCDMLGDPSLRADSNFFLSGGESLLAIGIASQVRERYDIDIPLVAVFENPTPRRLGTALKAYLGGRNGL